MHDQSNLSERFWSKVDMSGDCWEWQGWKGRNGYGHLPRKYGIRLAHRFAYKSVIGDIPDTMFVCHHCDNPSCVRPDHLFIGTPRTNVKDCHSKGRGAFSQSDRLPIVLEWLEEMRSSGEPEEVIRRCAMSYLQIDESQMDELAIAWQEHEIDWDAASSEGVLKLPKRGRLA